MKVTGGCHCGLVQFEAELPGDKVTVYDCDCSICAMSGHRHLFVPDTAFRLTDGKLETGTYRFGAGKARHIFCRQCGVKSFLRAGDAAGSISLDYRCLDSGHGLDVTFEPLAARAA